MAKICPRKYQIRLRCRQNENSLHLSLNIFAKLIFFPRENMKTDLLQLQHWRCRIGRAVINLGLPACRGSLQFAIMGKNKLQNADLACIVSEPGFFGWSRSRTFGSAPASLTKKPLLLKQFYKNI